MTTGRHSAPQPTPDPPSGKPPADRIQILVAAIAAAAAIGAAAIGAVTPLLSNLLSNSGPVGAAPALPVSTAVLPPSSGTASSATVQPPATAPSSTETPRAVTSPLYLSSQSPFRADAAAPSVIGSWKIEGHDFSQSIGFPGLCSRADATYSLGGSYAYFYATAGIADGLQPKDRLRSVTFDILDGQSGREIGQVTAQYGQSKTIKLPVEGITSIRLEIGTADGGCFSSQSVVVWGNPRLEGLSGSGWSQGPGKVAHAV